MDNTAIKVENVSKVFRLPHEKATTIKSLFTNVLRGERNRTYERQQALKGVSFEVKKGEFFGVVGRNGSGKSTLLKLLAGIYQPTKGTIEVHGKLVPFIELGVGFNPELTGKENVYLNGALLGFSKKQVDAIYSEIVEFAELENFMDQKLKNYSSGMQVRLAFSMAIRAKADILLVDEVLAVGDADFQRKCFEYFRRLKKDGCTVILVTHDMDAVLEYCDRAMLIDEHEIQKVGGPKDVASQYRRLFDYTDKVTLEESRGKRWGSEQVRYRNIEISPRLVRGETEIMINAVAEAKVDTDDILFGFSIRNSAGQVLVGTNSLLKGSPAIAMKKGEKRKVVWEIPHIFNDGEYFADLTIVKVTGEAYDWWEDAVYFTVRTDEANPYPVNPPMKVMIK